MKKEKRGNNVDSKYEFDVLKKIIETNFSKIVRLMFSISYRDYQKRRHNARIQGILKF